MRMTHSLVGDLSSTRQVGTHRGVVPQDLRRTVGGRIDGSEKVEEGGWYWDRFCGLTLLSSVYFSAFSGKAEFLRPKAIPMHQVIKQVLVPIHVRISDSP